MVFADKIVGGVIPRNFSPSVEKGIVGAMSEGAVAGFPIVDVKVTLFHGAYHTVDSSDMAFQIAASMGLKKGILQCTPVLPEPVLDVEVSSPEDMVGDIIGDLNGPAEVSKGLMVQYKVLYPADESETFVWTIPTGFLLTGGDDTIGSVQAWIGSTAESGNVRVLKTNLCGASNEKFKYVTVTSNDCTGCPFVKVFPNPASKEIYISYSSGESGDKFFFEKQREYMIVDAQGKVVYEYKSKQTNLILNLQPIKGGVYTLVIKHGNPGTFQLKFIIAR